MNIKSTNIKLITSNIVQELKFIKSWQQYVASVSRTQY